jgi:hypothetical protein
MFDKMALEILTLDRKSFIRMTVDRMICNIMKFDRMTLIDNEQNDI